MVFNEVSKYSSDIFRQDTNLARMERDRLVVESNYAREQLQRIINDSENQVYINID